MNVNLMKHKKGLLVFGVCVLFVCIGFCIYQRPEIKLKIAVDQLQKEAQVYHNLMLEDIQPLELYKNRQETPYHDVASLTVSVPDFAIPALSSKTYTMDQFSLQYDGVYDNKQQTIQGDFQLGVFQMNLVQGSIWAEDTMAYFEIPSLLSDSYYVNLDTLGKDFNQSAFSEFTGKTLPEELSVHPFIQGERADWAQMDVLLQDLISHAIHLRSYVEIANTNQKKTITQNGSQINCEAVKLSLQPYAVNDMQQYLEVLLLHSTLYQQQAQHLIADQEKKAGLEDDIFQTVYDEEVEVLFYLNQARHLVRIEAETKAYAFCIDLAGEERSLDDIMLTMTPKQTEEKTNCQIRKQTMVSEERYENDVTLNHGETTVMSYSDCWNHVNNSLTLQASLAQGSDVNSVSLKGVFEEVTPKEGFTFQIADLYVEENGEAMLRAAGQFSMEPCNDTQYKQEQTIDTEQALDFFALPKIEILTMLLKAIKSIGGSLLP